MLGRSRLTLGEEVYDLRQGDAITFIPATSYQWDNRGDVLAQVVCITRRSVSDGVWPAGAHTLCATGSQGRATHDEV